MKTVRLMIALLILLPGVALGAVETTTIAGKVLMPNGGAATAGSIIATLAIPGSVDDLATSEGQRVGGRYSGTIDPNGAVTGLVLVPNDVITPVDTYYAVQFNITSPVRTSWTETWQVDTAPDPVDIGDITRLNVAPGISVVSAPGLSAWFGDGSDGDLTTASLTLTRDAYYNDLTVAGPVITAGYRLFVKGTLTINAGGSVHADGGNGVAGSGASAGAGAAAVATGNVGGGSAGGSGGAGQAGNGTGSISVSAVTGMGGAGGTAPAGGNGFSTTGGAGGSGGSATYAPHRTLGINLSYAGSSLIQGGAGGRGGGGGGGDNGAAIGGGGGGGGAGGGVVAVLANTIVINASGRISANGGNGGAGAAGTLNGGDGAGGGSGGGGGGGGFVYIVSRTLTNSGSIQANGGSAGAGGSAAGGGSAGASGSAGSAGRIVKISLKTGVIS